MAGRFGGMVSALGIVAVLTGCGPGGPPPAKPVPTSPNGEPLVGAGEVCEPALAGWFDKADRNRDGHLDMAEMQADAERWFGVMDANRDGTVTPDELTALRLRLMPPAQRPSPGYRGDGEPLDERAREPRWRRQRGPADEPDPVMAADVNLDNRVTPDEFRNATIRSFQSLDVNHDGRLSREEVAASCRRPRR